MTRTEARNKTLWNILPKQIRNDITKNVEYGFFLKMYYKSENTKLFNNINATVNVLVQLGYDAEIEQIGDIDSKLTIRW